MEELTSLRALRSDIDEPDWARLEPGFRRLERRMSRAARRARPGHERRRSIRVVSAMAAAAVVALVAGHVTFTTQSAAASSVLRAAADGAVRNADAALAPGQFEVVETRWRIAPEQTDGATDSTVTVYRPADPDADWVYVATDLRPGRGTEVRRAKEGAFFGREQWTIVDLDALPRDGAALLAWFDARYSGASVSRNEDDWVRITDVLKQGFLPSELRAAMFDALALIPGSTVGDRTTSIGGRVGVAIGRTEWDRLGERQEIVIDPDTGEYLGARTLLTVPVPGIGSAGTVLESTAVTTSVVDSAP